MEGKKVVGLIQVEHNKKLKKIFFYFSQDNSELDFFQNLLFQSRKLKPLKDERYINKSNEFARLFWATRVTCDTRTLIVGCFDGTIGCVPIYQTSTTCSTIYVLIDDGVYGGGDSTNYPDSGYTYPRGRGWNDDQYVDPIYPCDKIKEKLNDSRYIDKFEHLNTNEVLSMNRDRGFFERQSPPANNSGSSFIQLNGQDGTTGLSLPTNLDGIIGLLHSHNDKDGVIKIFSPTDVRTFINHFLRQAKNYTGSYSNAYSTVVTSEGSYTLKYSNTTHPGGINFDTFTKWESWYVQKYEQLIRNDNLTQENVEKLFTQFLKEVVNIYGLELYKVTSNSSKKIEYNGKNNPVKTTECPS